MTLRRFLSCAQDEFGLPRTYLLVFLLLSGFGGYAAFLLFQHYEDQGKKVHLVVKLLSIAYVMQLVSVFFELVHLWFYKSNGVGLLGADLLSEMLEGLSQTTISFVLICLASGWTLVDVDEDAARPNSVGTLLRNPSTLLSGANAVVFGLIMLVALTMVLQQVDPPLPVSTLRKVVLPTTNMCRFSPRTRSLAAPRTSSMYFGGKWSLL